MYFEEDPRLRELCEKASKELDHDKLIDLVRQINELLEKQRRRPAGSAPEKRALFWVAAAGNSRPESKDTDSCRSRWAAMPIGDGL